MLLGRERVEFLMEADDGLISGPEINFGVDDDIGDVIISDIPPEPEPPKVEVPEDTDEVLKRIDDLQRQNQLLNAQLEQARNIKIQMPEGVGQQGQNRVQPQQIEDPSVFEKDLNENFYTNPVKYLEEFQKRKIQPALMASVNNSILMGKRFLEVDPERRENYKKYQKEIDQKISQLPPAQILQNPNIFNDAYDAVLATHMDEVVSDRINSQLETLLNQRLQELGIELGEDGRPVQGGAKPTQSSRFKGEGLSSSIPKPSGTKSATLTTAEAREADRRGVTYEDYYRYLKGKGLK